MTDTTATQGAFELVMARHSAKQFDGKALTQEQVEKIKADLETATTNTPFGLGARYRFAWTTENVSTGLVNNPSGTIIALHTGDLDRATELDMSFAFERLHVETITGLGLSTCWISASLNREKAVACAAKAGEKVPFVAPVGHSAPSLIGRSAAWMQGMGKREPLQNFVFDGEVGKPMGAATLNEAHPLWKAFEAVRWAPSAYNKQPARIVVGPAPDGPFSLFLTNAVPQYHNQDAGIAMFHFDSVMRQLGKPGTWSSSPAIASASANPKFTYFATFTLRP